MAIKHTISWLAILTTAAIQLQGVTAFPSSSNGRQECRLLPTDKQWPKPSEWKKLNSTLEGRLITSIPMASPCHDPHYNEVECNKLKDIWSKPQSYFGHPTQIMAPIFQNLTCAPYTPRTDPCLLGPLASYAINVSSPSDVSKGLSFARRHNLRISIKNTGHDYLGKSAGTGSLALWTHNLKSISFKKYVSKGYTGPSIRMGAGVQAFEAYGAAAKAGYVVVGGHCPTVGLAGGYTQGGGHGPLSTAYGLGADQVLEWEVVTVDGKHVTATPSNKHADLYWALSGGGGGTYAVVLSLTAKAHPEVPVGGATMAFAAGNMSGDAYYGLIDSFYSYVPALLDERSSLATYFTKDRFVLQVMTKLNTTAEQMLAHLRPFTSQLEAAGVAYNITTSQKSRFIDHVDKYLGPLPYGIYDSSQMIGGRLIPRDVLDENRSGLMSAFRQMAERGYEVDVLCQNVTHALSGALAGKNAVNSAWRDSAMHVVVAEYWDYSMIKAQNLDVVREIAEDIMPLLYEITPGSGVYLNEADFQDPNWKWDFYGVNYDKLRWVKQRYDRDDVLYANRAVGSDEWEVKEDGRLCKLR